MTIIALRPNPNHKMTRGNIANPGIGFINKTKFSIMLYASLLIKEIPIKIKAMIDPKANPVNIKLNEFIVITITCPLKIPSKNETKIVLIDGNSSSGNIFKL